MRFSSRATGVDASGQDQASGLRLTVRRPRTLILLVGGVGLLAGLLTAGLLVGAGLQPTQDERAIRSVISEALLAKQTLVVPPTSYLGGQVPDAMQAEMLNRVSATLAKYYRGDPLARYSAAIQNSIRAMSDGKSRAFGGGISSLDIYQIAIRDNTALVTARAFTWSEVGQVSPNGKMVKARPQNGEDFTFTLVKADGQWLINGESWTFVPGTEP